MLGKAVDAVLVVCAVALTGLVLRNSVHGSDHQTIDIVRELGTLAQVDVPLPRLAVESVDGTTYSVPRNSAEFTLLYFFSTRCPACQANEATWIALVDSVKGMAEAVALSPQPIEMLAAAYPVGAEREYDVVGFADPSSRDHLTQEYRMFVTPITYAIDGGGRVRLARSGILDEKDIRDVIDAVREP